MDAEQIMNSIALDGTFTLIAKQNIIKQNGISAWVNTLDELHQQLNPDQKLATSQETGEKLEKNGIDKLFETILDKQNDNPEKSWTAKLLTDGTDAISSKVIEEALETVEQAKFKNRENLIKESADLLYHLLVLWADGKVTPDCVYRELARREGRSGIEEKRSRK